MNVVLAWVSFNLTHSTIGFFIGCQAWFILLFVFNLAPHFIHPSIHHILAYWIHPSFPLYFIIILFPSSNLLSTNIHWSLFLCNCQNLKLCNLNVTSNLPKSILIMWYDRAKWVFCRKYQYGETSQNKPKKKFVLKICQGISYFILETSFLINKIDIEIKWCTFNKQLHFNPPLVSFYLSPFLVLLLSPTFKPKVVQFQNSNIQKRKITWVDKLLILLDRFTSVWHQSFLHTGHVGSLIKFRQNKAWVS